MCCHRCLQRTGMVYVCFFCYLHVSLQFVVHVDPSSLSSPMEMETDGPLIEDVAMLKKTVEEEATQVKTGIVVYRTCEHRLKQWFSHSVLGTPCVGLVSFRPYLQSQNFNFKY